MNVCGTASSALHVGFTDNTVIVNQDRPVAFPKTQRLIADRFESKTRPGCSLRGCTYGNGREFSSIYEHRQNTSWDTFPVRSLMPSTLTGSLSFLNSDARHLECAANGLNLICVSNVPTIVSCFIPTAVNRSLTVAALMNVSEDELLPVSEFPLEPRT